MKHAAQAAAGRPLAALLIAFGLWIASMVAAHAAASLVFTAEEQAWIDKHPDVVVGMHDVSIPPLQQWTPAGEPSGMAGDYLQRLSQLTGLRLLVQRFPTLAERDAAFLAGRVDLLPLVFSGDTIEPQALVSPPYLRLQSVYLTRQDTADFSPTGNFGGLRLGVTIGSAYEGYLRRRFPAAQLVPMPSPLEQVKALSDGRVDAMLAILPLATYVAETHRLSNLTVRAYAPDAPNSFALGTRPALPLLHRVLTKALAAIDAAEHDRIQAKWMPSRHFLRVDATIALTDTERDWLRRNGRLRVAYDRSFSPFTEEHDRKMQGLGADLLYTLARRLGLEIVDQRAGSWAEVYAATAAGEADLLVAAGRNEERRETFRFVGPWSSTPTGIVTRVGRPGPASLADIGAGTLAMLDDHFLIPALTRQYPGMTIARFRTLEEVLGQVRDGKAAAGIGNLQVISMLIRRDHPGALTIVGAVPDGDSELFFAVHREKPLLASILDKGLASLSDSERRDINARWLTAVYQPGWTARAIAIAAAPWAACVALVALLLTLHQHRLKREIARRRETQDALTLSLQRLQEVSSSKSRFIASMSHEIRNPLSSVLAAAEMLQARALDARGASLAQAIANSARGLLELLARALDFSKAESGLLTLHPQWISLDQWCREAVAAHQAAAERKQLRLVVEGPADRNVQVYVDPTRLGQVLSNLLSNAVKFSEHGTVRIRAAADTGAGRLRLSVEDEGPGVPASERHRLFLPYSQLQTSAAPQGHGLGLALCQQLIEHMGGRISLREAASGGCRFDVDLPAACRSATGERAPAPPRAASTATPPLPEADAAAPIEGWPPAVALLLDDDPVGRMIHGEVLRSLGWEVREHAEPTQALDDWVARPTGLLLVDYHMPVLEGPDFAIALRERAAQRGRQPCIVALTGEDDPAIHTRCRAAGMDAVLVKPLRPAALHGCLRTLAPRYGLQWPDRADAATG